MSAIVFPATLYQTKHQFNDHSSDDMQCGDLTEKQLRSDLGLDDVSNVVDPWTGEEVSIFSSFRKSQPKSKTEIAQILFDEFLRSSLPTHYLGQHNLFNNLVKHFYHGNGKSYSSPFLDSAYKSLILNEQSSPSSSLKIIQSLLDKVAIDVKNGLSDADKNLITKAIGNSILPKFNRWADSFNGLGMSIHDIYATKIQLTKLDITESGYVAKVTFTGQDHFGLDKTDIMNMKFHYIRAFRIWFVLQRWEKFAFKPFFTNMKAEFEISSRRNG
ncbi:DUF3289 family protein [Pantoea ananatis]|uniref:DUF3289 family protein n=1 Tax=Pantoea ananas TaxID=553 RepID=UPI000CF38033|nr:DUF3289 family protein [Pantoea ananatis]PQK94581.1 hypothetical protein CG434_22730 [Pantoea ananatis]